MKTFVMILLAGAFSMIALPVQAEETVGEQASDAWRATKKTTKKAAHAVADTTKDAAHSVAKGTKKAAHKVKEALTADPDANQVNVTVNENKIDMPRRVQSGKTAFVVKNSGQEKHNFEVRGQGTEEKFLLPLAPNQTKVLHVYLEPGRYKANVLVDEKKTLEVNLTVK